MRNAKADRLIGSDDARFAITYFNTCVANADAKAALLFTGTVVLIGTCLGQKSTLTRAFPPTSPALWVAAASLAIAAAGAALTVVLLVGIIRPVITVTPFSRYSWPSAAAVPLEQLCGAAAESDRTEAWATAHALARISRAKFRRLQLAYVCWAGTFFALTAGLFIAR
jgi:hypothetical protein